MFYALIIMLLQLHGWLSTWSMRVYIINIDITKGMAPCPLGELLKTHHILHQGSIPRWNIKSQYQNNQRQIKVNMSCEKLLWETYEVILVLRNFLAKKELDSKCEMNTNMEAHM